MPEPLSRDEFIRHIDYVRADINEVKDHLDRLNGRTRTVESQLAVLEHQVEHLDPPTGKAAAWGGGVAGVFMAAGEVIKWFFGK